MLIPPFVADTGLPSQSPYPFGRTELCKVGMILVAPDRLIALQKAQELAPFDLLLGGLDEEGAAAAGTDKLVNLSYQFGGKNDMGSLSSHYESPL